MVEVIDSLVVPIMLSLVGVSAKNQLDQGFLVVKLNSWKINHVDDQFLLSDRSYIYSFKVFHKKINTNWWRDHTKLISSLTLLRYSSCFFFADITFPIYYLHHMVLDTTHNYYSLSLILSYPKLVVSLLLIFRIDMYFMFIF
jgi:hypothetical protein